MAVYFLDQQDLNAEVTGCNAELVDLSLETRVSHIEANYFSPAEPHGSFRRFSTLHLRPGATSQTTSINVGVNGKRLPIIYLRTSRAKRGIHIRGLAILLVTRPGSLR